MARFNDDLGFDHEAYTGGRRLRRVGWGEPRLVITRLRLISDVGYPYWDVSYCYGKIGDEVVNVALPFNQVPKYKPKKWLIQQACKARLFVMGLVQNISFYQ